MKTEFSETLFLLGEVYENKDKNISNSYFDQCIENEKKIFAGMDCLTMNIIGSYIKKGKNFRELKKYSESKDCLNRAYSNLEKYYADNFNSLGECSFELAITYLNLSELNNALKYGNNAVSYYKYCPNSPQLASAYNLLGNIYCAMEKTFLAEENYNIALKMYEYLAINDKSQNYGIFICLNNLATVAKSNSKEKYQKAKSYLTNNEKNKQRNEHINLCDMNIALCLSEEGKLEEALTELIKLKNNFNEEKNLIEISEVYYQMGNINLSKKKIIKLRGNY